MNDPTPLSPVAKAVLDAVHGQDAQSYPLIVAAVLREAADQVVPPDEEPMPLNLAHRVRWNALQSVRYQLFAIAAELDGGAQ